MSPSFLPEFLFVCRTRNLCQINFGLQARKGMSFSHLAAGLPVQQCKRTLNVVPPIKRWKEGGISTAGGRRPYNLMRQESPVLTWSVILTRRESSLDRIASTSYHDVAIISHESPRSMGIYRFTPPENKWPSHTSLLCATSPPFSLDHRMSGSVTTI